PILEDTIGNSIEILAEDYLSPSRLQDKTGSWQGAIYGESLNSLSRMAHRSRLINTKYSKLYCIGGTVHPGGGIPLALRSAKIVAGML
ncbi:MAG: phytoene desaturase, partial [Patescibacteria group bacterium]|nr:phytoene desaturase [Patescibacteria group bacterium]